MRLEVKKLGKNGKSKIIQTKRIIIKPKEEISPFLAKFKLSRDDIYQISLKVYSEGKLIYKKTITSGERV